MEAKWMPGLDDGTAGMVKENGALVALVYAPRIETPKGRYVKIDEMNKARAARVALIAAAPEMKSLLERWSAAAQWLNLLNPGEAKFKGMRDETNALLTRIGA